MMTSCLSRSFLGSLLMLGVAALPAGGAQSPADLVVVNGRVLTMDPARPQASAVAVRGDVIAAVGEDGEIRRLVGPATRVIDAGGRSVVPGLIESHVHATRVARGEAVQPFVQLHSIGEIQDWVRRKAGDLPRGNWISLPRVDVTRVRERRIPNREDLDAAAPDHPAVFTWQYANRVVQILNSAALRAAGITGSTEPPPGGRIHLDEKGEPNGMTENCNALLQRFLPGSSLSDEQYHDALERLLRRYNEIGITSIGERNSNVEGYRTYQKLHAQGRLPVRATVTIGLTTDGTEAATRRAIAALPVKTGEGDDWVRVGPLKLGVDGGILYGTAHMREPYGPSSFSLYGIDDPLYRGDLRIGREQLKTMIRVGQGMGWQMSAHVTGDAGVDAVLDAVEAANAQGPVVPGRFILIHAYFPNPETARRAASLGVGVDTQAAWYYKDGDALAEALGGARLKNFIGLRTWVDAGVRTALNADHMQGADPDKALNPYNPFLAMQTAVSRKTEGGQVFGPEQRISREEALRMVTIDAAWLNFDEARRGSLEVGKLADLAVLTGDLLGCEEERMKDLRAQVTIVGGRVVYDRSK